MTKKIREYESYSSRQNCISMTIAIFQIITIYTSTQINSIYRQQSDNAGFTTISYIQLIFASINIFYYLIKHLYYYFSKETNIDKCLFTASYFLIFDIIILGLVIVEFIFSITMYVWINDITIFTNNKFRIYQHTVVNIVFLVLSFIWTFGYTYMSYYELCVLLAMRKVIQSLPCCKYQLVANNGLINICKKCQKNFSMDDSIRALPDDSLYHFNCLNDVASDATFVVGIENMLSNQSNKNKHEKEKTGSSISITIDK